MRPRTDIDHNRLQSHKTDAKVTRKMTEKPLRNHLRMDSLDLTSCSRSSCSSSDSANKILKQTTSASFIRKKLLNKLGMVNTSSLSPPPSPKEEHSILAKENSTCYVAPLNDEGKDDDCSSSPHLLGGFQDSLRSILFPSTSSLSTACSEDTPTRDRSISFDAEVMIHTIPIHSDYSDRIRSQLWTPPQEMAQNCARNCVEYAAEGWNPENVFLEEDMVLLEGEMIHPVHFAKACNLSQHFCKVMSQQTNQEH